MVCIVTMSNYIVFVRFTNTKQNIAEKFLKDMIILIIKTISIVYIQGCKKLLFRLVAFIKAYFRTPCTMYMYSTVHCTLYSIGKVAFTALLQGKSAKNPRISMVCISPPTTTVQPGWFFCSQYNGR